MKVRGHRKLKGTIFFSPTFLGELFLQITVEFGEINVRNTTSENTREADTKPPKILVECNGYPEMFSLSGAVEIFRRYLLIRTDILQKTVDGCPCYKQGVCITSNFYRERLPWSPSCETSRNILNAPFVWKPTTNPKLYHVYTHFAVSVWRNMQELATNKAASLSF